MKYEASSGHEVTIVLVVAVSFIFYIFKLYRKEIEPVSKRDKIRGRKAKAVEAEIVSTVAVIESDKEVIAPEEEKKVKLFVFGNLNIHANQELVWGETMQGVAKKLLDFELCQNDDNSFYVTLRMGEDVVGRLYELTEPQLDNTDQYESNMERIEVTENSEKFYVYVPKKEN